jgi:hypothetical protein
MKPPEMPMGSYDAATEKNRYRHFHFLQQAFQLSVASMPVIHGDYERLWRQLPRWSIDAGA